MSSEICGHLIQPKEQAFLHEEKVICQSCHEILNKPEIPIDPVVKGMGPATMIRPAANDPTVKKMVNAAEWFTLWPCVIGYMLLLGGVIGIVVAILLVFIERPDFARSLILLAGSALAIMAGLVQISLRSYLVAHAQLMGRTTCAVEELNRRGRT